MDDKKQKGKKEEHDEETQKRFEELENQVKRSVADYRNLEKRVEEEKREFAKFANRELLLSILPTLDHLETALKGGAESGSGWYKGVEMAVSEFRKFLELQGVEIISIHPNDDFDPNFEEVVQVKAGPDGKVMDVMQSGYLLHGKLLRPARVVVGKSTEEN